MPSLFPGLLTFFFFTCNMCTCTCSCKALKPDVITCNIWAGKVWKSRRLARSTWSTQITIFELSIDKIHHKLHTKFHLNRRRCCWEIRAVPAHQLLSPWAHDHPQRNLCLSCHPVISAEPKSTNCLYNWPSSHQKSPDTDSKLKVIKSAKWELFFHALCPSQTGYFRTIFFLAFLHTYWVSDNQGHLDDAEYCSESNSGIRTWRQWPEDPLWDIFVFRLGLGTLKYM